jgi:RimJ/RimL family protein N-acetyltransferase
MRSVTDEIAAARIALVPLAVSDADEMVGVLDGDELYTFIGGQPPTLPELRARYAQQVIGHSADGRYEWHNWIIRLTPGWAAVGYLQATILDDGQCAEIAWVVGRHWQGRGYAKEAAAAVVGWLDGHGIRTVQAHVHPDHTASAAVARYAGLLPTGQIEDGEQLWLRRTAMHS